MVHKLDVFVPAGTGESLSHYSQLLEAAGVKNKSKIRLNGKQLIDYVVEAIDNAEITNSITIGGLTKDDLEYSPKNLVQFIEGGGTSFESYYKAAKHYLSLPDPPEYILTVSSDVPLITSEMIDRAVSAIDLNLDLDVYFQIVWHSDMLKRYPNASKIPIKLKEGWILASDMVVMRPEVIERYKTIIQNLMAHRKSVFSFIRIVSFRYIIKYKLKRLSFHDIFRRFADRYGLRGAFWVTEFPEPCIDLDYFEDLQKFQTHILTYPRLLEDDEKAYLITAQFGEQSTKS